MSEYKETSISGTSYRRGRTIIFENPRNSTPSVFIKEENVSILDNRVIIESAGEIIKTVDNLSTTFQIRNPTTNEVIEGQTASYQDLYVLLYSLYWHLAEERDSMISEEQSTE